jgi:hypothetical protein
LKGVKVYHASGHEWNAAFGFHGVWQAKYEGDHPELFEAIHTASADQPLTIEVARSARAATRSD